MRSRLTVAQLADLAGVSPATVSKVINGRLDVGPQTRARVEEVIARHGYRRRAAAAGPTMPLEVLFHELAGPYPVEMLNGVQRVARRHRLAVVLSELQGGHVPADGWVEDALARRPTGVIAVFSGLTGEQATRLRARGIPLVAVDPVGECAPGEPVVGADNRSGGLEATRHLLALGHRRIAVITGTPGTQSSRARVAGYLEALAGAGVAADPRLIRVGHFQVEDGARHTRELLRLPEPPTAVFACNDGEALGVYLAAAEAGVRVPEELSVVGFDDVFPSQWTVPPLTTVRQPLAEMAATAASMVVALARGQELERSQVALATRLVVRASTAPPPR
ncbi:LacI family DNA-binding transcriptional regulator [Streptomyces hoynatensis]|uniref:LacI family DNA-binding transcriptional regulator n=1 Tax=Streptomyces hoynatensis TaxID=1141874 RepID=UPI001F4ECB87|nr:LacI family DNA-binding transcriptional regulator [Streptomyces hoynatensis]